MHTQLCSEKPGKPVSRETCIKRNLYPRETCSKGNLYQGVLISRETGNKGNLYQGELISRGTIYQAGQQHMLRSIDAYGQYVFNLSKCFELILLGPGRQGPRDRTSVLALLCTKYNDHFEFGVLLDKIDLEFFYRAKSSQQALFRTRKNVF